MKQILLVTLLLLAAGQSASFAESEGLGPAGPRSGGWVSLRASTAVHASSLFELEPGESSTLPVGEHRALMLVAGKGPQELGALVPYYSSDGVLFVRASWQAISERAVALRSDPLSTSTSLRLEHQGGSDSKVSFRAYTLPTERPGAGRFGRVYEPPTLPVRITRRAVAAQDDRYWALEPGRPLRVPVDGATRVRIDSRYRFGAEDGRARQTYRLYAGAGSQSWSLEHVTSVSTSVDLLVDGAAEAVGTRRSDFLELAPGQGELVLESTARLYARVLGEDRDLILPRLNGVGETGRTELVANEGSIWDLDPVDLGKLARGDDGDLAKLGAWLVRDNRFRGSSTQLLPMSRLLEDRSASAALRAEWRRKTGQAMSYRALLPRVKADTGPIEFRRFALPGDGIEEGRDEGHRVYRELGRDALGGIGSGFFVAAGRREDAHLYALPPGEDPTCLRLLVGRDGLSRPATLTLAPTGLAEIELKIVPPVPGSSGELGRTGGELAIARLDRQGRERSHPHLPMALRAAAGVSGEIGLWSQPGSVATVAAAEVCLPEPAREMALWSERAGPEVAVQLLAPRTFRLSEGEYLHHVDLLRSAGVNLGDLFRMLTRPDASGPLPFEAGPRERDALAALVNHWRPLGRSLAALDRAFAAGLRAPELVPPADSVAGAVTAHDAAPGDPVQRLAWVVDRERRFGPDSEMLEAKVAALDAAGELYLAERTLRQAVLHPDAELAAEARQMLLSRYQREDDRDATLRLYAATALRRPTSRAIAGLVETLVESGRSKDALSLAALGIEAAPEPLLRAALAERWWRTFDRALAELEGEAYALWQGYRAFSEARYELAESSLRRAGEAGKKIIDSIERSRRLAAKLEDAKEAKLDRIVTEWHRWEASHPGPHSFQEEPWLVRDASGADSVYVSHLELPIPYFRATPQRPIRLEATGPARLRLELRPLLEESSGPQSDVWLRVTSGGVVERLLIPAGRPSRTVSMAAPGSAFGVGQRTEVDIVVGEGTATIELSAEDSSVLSRVLAWRPQFPLTSLPKLARGWEATAELDGKSEWLCRASLRQRRVDGCHRIDGTVAGAIAAQGRNPAPQGVARVQVVPGSPSASDPELYRTMLGYLQALESGSTEEMRRAIALGEALYWQHRERGDLARLHSRLSRSATWRRLRSIEGSTGIRRVEGNTWSPEEPALRVRRSLLDGVEPADLMVVGRQRLGLSISSSSETRFQVTFELAQVPPLTAEPLVANTSFNGAPLAPVTVDREQSRAVRRLRVKPGQHELVFSIASPRANQYLRLRVEELGPEGRVPQLRSWQRDYHVATADHPLELRVDAPSWLRIDELRDGATISSYRLVDGDGWERVEIAPEVGSSRAMYRVFQRALAEPSAPLAAATGDGEVEELSTLGRLYELPEQRSAMILPDLDGLRTGSGTTQSLGLAVERRRVVEDEIFADADAEEFTELGWSHRKGRESTTGAQRHRELALLGRLRQEGEPTVGSELYARLGSPRGAWTLNASARGYAQEIETGDTEWSATLRLSLGRTFRLNRMASTRLLLGGFGRELSLDAKSVPETPSFIDQDIFTSYKADHRYGARIAQSFTVQPKRDLGFWAQISLNTNEALGDLDNAAAELALRELVGPLRLDLRFRVVRYFADANRSEALDRQRVSVRWAWERWTRGLGRWELGGQANYDLNAGQYSGTLFLSRHFSAGRGLQDFRPAAADFRSLREERLESREDL